MTKLHKPTCEPIIYCREKINKLFGGLRLVNMVKNCDLGLENAAICKTSDTVFHYTGLPATK